MRASRRRRPRKREILVPQDVDLEEVASLAAYVGSAERKDIPSYAGQPRRRPDASSLPARPLKRSDENRCLVACCNPQRLDWRALGMEIA